MPANNKRMSTYTTSTGSGPDARNGEQKKDLWNTMLGSVASGKRLPQKNLMVFGGTPESQREALEALSGSDFRGSLESPTPVANNFALGYAYYDVLDADHEDILARISLYFLSNPTPAFTSLLSPLLTSAMIPNTLIVILLDWSEPHMWLRRLQEWILLLRVVFRSLGSAERDAMEEVMASWRNRGREGGSMNLDGSAATGGVAGGAGTVNGGAEPASPSHGMTGGPMGGEVDDEDIRLGPGEWEDGLGLPLCVVCQNAQKIDFLEKSKGWKEADFDQVLQYLRTVLLRHGASLIYTTPNVSSPFPTLIHSTLGITSLLKRQPLRHNVIDRDKILVPPNWDSWGKIRVLRDGFDVDAVSSGWSNNLHASLMRSEDDTDNVAHEKDDATADSNGVLSAVELYEQKVHDPDAGTIDLRSSAADRDDNGREAGLEVDSQDSQEFLQSQMRILEALRAKTAKEDAERAKRAPSATEEGVPGSKRPADSGVSQHIGPVQFNMGGIQVDADDMVQRLKDRQTYQDATVANFGSDATPSTISPPIEPLETTEQLTSFFTGLLNRGGGGGANAKTGV